MAEKPGFDQLPANSTDDETETYGHGDPPPSYNETAMMPLKDTPPSAPVQHPYQPQGFYSPPMAVPQPAPVQVVVPPPAPVVTNVVVGMGNLPPGTCTVCRRGKIEDTASCCTWFWCCVLLPLGIIPGIIAFCCCCRRPKCTHCGFSI